DRREFGPRLQILQVYFVTSPMLVLSIAYYFDRTMSAKGHATTAAYALVTAVNIVGMILAGTRNNMLVAVLLPFLLWPLYTRRLFQNYLITLILVTLLSLP